MSDETTQEKTLSQRTFGGAAWALAGRGAQQTLGVVITLIFMAVFTPEHRGFVGMALVFIYILGDIRDLRFAEALIQRKEITPLHISCAVTAQSGVALLAALALACASPLVADFYGEPKLLLVTMVLAAQPFLESLADVPQALLARRMSFKVIAFSNVAALAGSGLVAVALALRGHPIWALVGFNVIGSAIRSGMLLIFAGGLPRPRWDRRAAAELWKFSMYLYGARAVSQVSRNIDKLLVGKMLGKVALGIYGLGFRLMMMPLEKISWEIGRVMFSALSKIQDDDERFRNAYVRSLRLLSLITFPITAGLALTAGEFIGAVAKPEWADAVVIVRIFCLTGFLESVATTVGWIFFARGKTDWEFLWHIISLVATVVAVVVGIQFGVEGVAWAYLVRTVVLLIPAFAFAFRFIHLKLSSLIDALGATAIAAGFMAGCVWAARAAMIRGGALPVVGMLGVEVAVGVVTYVGWLYLWKPKAWRDGAAAVVSALSMAGERDGT
jgi:lipopolysaccharide exporter